MITEVKSKVGKGTVYVSIILLILFCPLFWLPFCIDKWKNKIHYCSNKKCGKIVGSRLYSLC